ncbi:PQQ-binding-like beta-propeller repeat protein [Streptomyces sp. T-3]|nr:PQQ-binding-like beta-propeller repeat protein [Streptomyces sp. T-3]
MTLRDSDPAEIGGYRTEERLGSGGMGVVYLARSASGRRLAIKLVHAQYADNPEFRARFRREVAAARQVSGAFTAPVVDADADADHPWMATLYIPGENLGTHVRRDGPLPLPRLRELATGLVEALRDLHRVGVIHRDLKPANVMLAEDGPRVIDFGISRDAHLYDDGQDLTETGRVMGTPPFMSPEQLADPREVGPAADVFSLGSVLVYAATGRGPFDSVSPFETATRVVTGDPELGGVPDELRPLVEACLDKHPKSRPTPDELLAMLQGRPAPARPTAEAEAGAAPRRRRHRRPAALTAVGMVLVALAVTLVVRLTDGEGPPAGDVPEGWTPWNVELRQEKKLPATVAPDCLSAYEALYCTTDSMKAVKLDPATGRELWHKRFREVTLDGSSDPPGERRMIGAAHGLVYVHDLLSVTVNPEGEIEDSYAVQALDRRTGEVRWTEPTARIDPDVVTRGEISAALVGNTVFMPDGKGKSILRVDARTGTSRGRAPISGGKADTRFLLPAGDRAALIHQTTGDEGNATRVTFLGADKGQDRRLKPIRGHLSPLGTDRGDLVLLRADDMESKVTHQVRIDLRTGERQELRLPQNLSWTERRWLADGIVYGEGSGRVFALSARTGRRLWERGTSVNSLGAPVVAGGTAYFGNVSGRMLALDTATGNERWSTLAPKGTPPADPMGEENTRLTLDGDALYAALPGSTVFSIDVTRHQNTPGPARNALRPR